VPALLHTLQNEWDALVLETFQLKQSYLATRQELSYALYAQDAATRVVARLIKERDASRECVLCAVRVVGRVLTGVVQGARERAGVDGHHR
jgi:pre-mRNA-processing factor 19